MNFAFLSVLPESTRPQSKRSVEQRLVFFVASLKHKEQFKLHFLPTYMYSLLHVKKGSNGKLFIKTFLPGEKMLPSHTSNSLLHRPILDKANHTSELTDSF